jgi:hypothetical protein
MAPKFQRQTPQTRTNESTREQSENGTADVGEGDGTGTVERLIENIVESQTADLREQLEDLEKQIEDVDNFARISLNERKVKQNEVQLSEFSASLTSFAEKAFNNINTLEDRLDRQALVLSAILESLDDDDIDLSTVRRYENDRLVTDTSPNERLGAAISGDGSESVE